MTPAIQTNFQQGVIGWMLKLNNAENQTGMHFTCMRMTLNILMELKQGQCLTTQQSLPEGNALTPSEELTEQHPCNLNLEMKIKEQSLHSCPVGYNSEQAQAVNFNVGIK